MARISKLLTAALILVAGLYVILELSENSRDSAHSQSGEVGFLAPEVESSGAWINSEPLRLRELRGKVVLIDFWTYSCRNCINTLPFLSMWYKQYSNDGLIIIGVHSPEFFFERDLDNLEKAVERHSIKYPVVQDNDFVIWNAYNNRYWPHKYLIDKRGVIRYHHIGEGAYDETETWIKRLLKE